MEMNLREKSKFKLQIKKTIIRLCILNGLKPQLNKMTQTHVYLWTLICIPAYVTLKISLIERFNHEIKNKATHVGSIALTIVFLQTEKISILRYVAACAFQNLTYLSTIQIIYIYQCHQWIISNIVLPHKQVDPPISAIGRQPTNISNEASAHQYQQ